jgi:uncharacterized protein
VSAPGRFRRWLDQAMPSREAIENNRWLRPFATRMMHSSLWRFTRRSVPRGVALGMVTGILVPMGQIPASAVLALPLRANIPAAAATTFFTNPLTTPPLWLFAYWVGSQFVGERGAKPQDPSLAQGWGEWLLNDAAPTLVTGLVTVTVVLAILGYFLSALGWRLWIARKWRKRSAERSARPIDAA